MSGWLDIYSTFDIILPSVAAQVTEGEIIDGVNYIYLKQRSDLPKAIIYRDLFFIAALFAI